MLDIATDETSLDAKRRDIASKIAEGRQVVGALQERQAAIGAKIEEALAGLQRLQEQLTAIDTVLGLVDHREIRFQPPRPAAPMLEVVTTVEPSAEAGASLRSPFRPVSYLKCMTDGHEFMNSRAMPGYVTCRRCRVRRRP